MPMRGFFVQQNILLRNSVTQKVYYRLLVARVDLFWVLELVRVLLCVLVEGWVVVLFGVLAVVVGLVCGLLVALVVGLVCDLFVGLGCILRLKAAPCHNALSEGYLTFCEGISFVNPTTRSLRVFLPEDSVMSNLWNFPGRGVLHQKNDLPKAHLQAEVHNCRLMVLKYNQLLQSWYWLALAMELQCAPIVL